jgi:acyl-CoA hydrolase
VVEDYYSHIGVITVTLKQPLKVGDRIHVRGHTTDISQGVASMQIDHAPVTEAGKGAALGIKIGGKCRRGDYIYKVS